MIRSSNFISLLVFLLVFSSVSFPGHIPGWVKKAKKPERTVTESSDYKADVLLRERKEWIDSEGKAHVRTRRVVKINDGEIRDVFRRNGVFFSSQYAGIHSKSAWHIKESGEINELGSQHFTVNSAVSAIELYSDRKSQVVEFTHLEAGDIIAWEIERKIDRPFSDGKYRFTKQRDEIFVAKSRFILELPSSYHHSAHLNHTKEGLKRRKEGNATIWTLENIPPPEKIRYLPPEEETKPQIVYYYSKENENLEWEDVIDWYSKLIQGRARADKTIKRKARELIEGKESRLEQIRALFEFVRDDIRYEAIEIGIGGLKPHKSSTVCYRRYGDCKDKAILLKSLLSCLDIESYPILIRAKYYHVPRDMPSLKHFNHVILGIAIDNKEGKKCGSTVKVPGLGSVLFVDPTNTATPFGSLSVDYQGVNCLLIDKKHGKLLKSPKRDFSETLICHNFSIDARRAGKTDLEAKYTFKGASVGRIEDILNNLKKKKQKALLRKMLQERFSSIKVKSYDYKKMKDVFNPKIELSATYEVKNYARVLDDLYLLNTNFSGVDLLKIRDLENRENPMFLRYPKTVKRNATFNLSSSLKIDSLPEDASYNGENVRFLLSYEKKDRDTFEKQLKIEYRSETLKVEETKTFLGKLRNELRKQPEISIR